MSRLEETVSKIATIDAELSRLIHRARFYNEVPSKADLIQQLVTWQTELSDINETIISEAGYV